MMALGVYIHIPFCKSKCKYCDFYSAGGSYNVPHAYVNAIVREIEKYSPNGLGTLQPTTVYFGGGTPSLLSAQQVEAILKALAPANGAEITLEANPDTVSLQSLTAYKAVGINRLSFGIQTASDESLQRLGRVHTAQTSVQALQMAQTAGFTNISGDIMLALPSYSVQEMQNTIALLQQNGCTHISAYLLKIEQNTMFGRKPPSNLPTDDEDADYYLACVQALKNAGYQQYEISNFAKEGFESKHNLVYWNCENYLGIGAAAHSCMNGKRFAMQANTAAFMAKPAVVESMGEADWQDYVMLQLRLTKGLNFADLLQRYQINITPQWQTLINQLVNNESAVFENQILRLTPKGMLIQNAILAQMLQD